MQEAKRELEENWGYRRRGKADHSEASGRSLRALGAFSGGLPF